MDERLKRKRQIEHIIFVIVEALDILHIAELFHLSSHKPEIVKIFKHHPETIRLAGEVICNNDQVWKMLSKNSAFVKDNRKKHYRTQLKLLLK